MASNSPEFVVSCLTCKRQFDALQAEWCDCITNDPTVICPHCGNCFCGAPKEYQSSFWSAAPQALWDLRAEYTERPNLPVINPEPGFVKRPLVLVVDDDPDIQNVSMRVVRDLGYGFILGRSGKEGLELTRRYRPDVVLTDALMPGLDGREMCRQIKADPELARTRVIIMSALYRQVRHRAEVRRDFLADDFVHKPLKLSVLREKLKKYVT